VAAAMAAPAVSNWLNRLMMGPVSIGLEGPPAVLGNVKGGGPDDRGCAAPVWRLGTSTSGARTRRNDGASLRRNPSLGRAAAVPWMFRTGPGGPSVEL